MTATALTIPHDALPFWQRRLAENNVAVSEPMTRFGQQTVAFEDPDGLVLELVARSDAASPAESAWQGTVPPEYAIRGMEFVTLTVPNREPTEGMLTTLGFTLMGEDAGRVRYTASAGESSTLVDLMVDPDAPRGSLGVGVVHHVAWRTPTDETELAWRKALLQNGRSVSPVMDRDYFHSIYFTEPGGVLFEIATNPPGFTVDEPLESLGTSLCLPPGLEESRAILLQALPALHLPGQAV